MKFKELKKQIKEEQKELASKIRNLKSKRKQEDSGYISTTQKRFTFRHKHIAYCQFFNKTPYEKIERSCNIEPNINIINKYVKEWYKEIEQDVCDCS
jgi:hypothetical protein